MILAIVTAFFITFTAGTFAHCDINGKNYDECIESQPIVYEYDTVKGR